MYRCARPGYTARNVLTGPPKQEVESLGTYHESLGTYQKYEGYGLLHRTLQPLHWKVQPFYGMTVFLRTILS